MSGNGFTFSSPPKENDALAGLKVALCPGNGQFCGDDPKPGAQCLRDWRYPAPGLVRRFNFADETLWIAIGPAQPFRSSAQGPCRATENVPVSSWLLPRR